MCTSKGDNVITRHGESGRKPPLHLLFLKEHKLVIPTPQLTAARAGLHFCLSILALQKQFQWNCSIGRYKQQLCLFAFLFEYPFCYGMSNTRIFSFPFLYRRVIPVRKAWTGGSYFPHAPSLMKSKGKEQEQDKHRWFLHSNSPSFRLLSASDVVSMI